MQFEDLKLPSGGRMKLTIAKAGSAQTTVQARFVGAHAPRSIIVAIPAAAITPGLEAGVKVAVSMVSPTDMIAFVSTIEAIGSSPFTHLFLSYPESISVRKVRSAARVNVGVTAQVTNLNAEDPIEMHEAQILDMSISGLKLASKTAIGRIGDQLALHVQLSVDNIARDTLLIGHIRSHGESPERGEPLPQTYGIEFAPMDDDKRVWLYAFVFCMIQRLGPQI